jgi:L-ascorbate metabolism protein UlaG (beta-lactamase superfamily)
MGGLSTLGLAAGAAYSVSPRFWNQFSKEMSRPIVDPPRIPDPASWPDLGVHAAWLGHATVLLKIDGFTLITDPALYSRIGLDFRVFTLGLKRIVAPALAIEKLPRLDLVLLSHAHMDHFDLPTLRALESRAVDLITASGTSDLLRVDRWRSVTELRWGQTTRIGPATFRAVEVRHWGARMQSDTWRGYNGYAIEVGKHRVLFGGDTADTHLFRLLHTARGFDLAVMPIGAYNPWIRNHCTPEQAWRMGNEAGSQYLLPIHHRTFALSSEPVEEPLARFVDAAGSHLNRVALDSIGGEFHLT